MKPKLSDSLKDKNGDAVKVSVDSMRVHRSISQGSARVRISETDVDKIQNGDLSDGSYQNDVEISSAVLELADDSSTVKIVRKSKHGLLILLVLVNWFNTMCYSIQAPFYPAAAEKKGATATEYGLVFGVFELVALVTTPFYGKYITKIGPKFMLCTGIFVTSVCAMLFGFLDMTPSSSFLYLSFAVRIVEALGSAAFTTACFTMCSMEFPDNRATAMAIVETAFGLGVITGPTIGGALFEVGGFPLPFMTLGLVLFISAIVAMFVLPTHTTTDRASANPLTILRHVPVAFAFFSVCSVTISTGFLTATLEPYLRQFGLSPFETGLMFMLNGLMYAITSPLWGRLGDKYKAPFLVCMCSAMIASVGYVIVGPLWFIPVEPSLWICVTALLIQGIGVQGEAVLGYMAALQALSHYGYPDDATTHSMATSLWVGSFSFGAFIGPSLGGFLQDEVGFRKGAIFIVVLHIMVAAVCFYYFKFFQRNMNKNSVYSKLNQNQNETNDLLNHNKKTAYDDI